MTTNNTPTIYQEIIEHFEGVTNLAKALKIGRQAIYLWNGIIPEGRAYQIESLTKGKFTGLDILERQSAERETKAADCV